MSNTTDLKEIDKNMAFENRSADGMDWYSVDDEGFSLDGLYWRKPGEPFSRIPLDTFISKGVNALACNTAGVMARFCTDASEIRIHARFDNRGYMDHMTTVGMMGFDLYLGSGTAKTYVRTTRIDPKCNEYTVTVFGPDAEKKMREFTLHFPLYAEPSFVRIGLASGAKVAPAKPWKDPRPVVCYGTSIQQGGCATRPGMCHTNIMSRLLDRPFINLGFSGSGRGEPQMAETIADIADPALIVLDYDANALVEGLRATLSDFIDILRKKQPETPILLVSRLPYAKEFYAPEESAQERADFTAIHQTELEKRRAAGDKNIYFLDGSTLYGDDPSACTVDGVHATDYGFANIARNMAPVIEKIITGQGL